MLIINRRFELFKGWPRIAEALVDRGYTVEEVDAAIASMPEQHCYREVKEHLELSLRKIRDEEVPLLTWWRTCPDFNKA